MGKASFDVWMKEVDKFLIAHFGLDHECLPDYLWYDLYEDDIEPQAAFDTYLEEDAYL